MMHLEIMDDLIGEKRKNKSPEADLQGCIVQALLFKGYFVYMNHQNIALGSFSKGEKVSNKYGMWTSMKKQGWVKGIPDLTVIGRTIEDEHIRVYIECKSKKGKLSDAQKEVIETLEALGEQVIIAKEIGDIECLLSQDILHRNLLIARNTPKS
jgi:hypothetical protein